MALTYNRVQQEANAVQTLSAEMRVLVLPSPDKQRIRELPCAGWAGVDFVQPMKVNPGTFQEGGNIVIEWAAFISTDEVHFAQHRLDSF